MTEPQMLSKPMIMVMLYLEQLILSEMVEMIFYYGKRIHLEIMNGLKLLGELIMKLPMTANNYQIAIT